MWTPNVLHEGRAMEHVHRQEIDVRQEGKENNKRRGGQESGRDVELEEGAQVEPARRADTAPTDDVASVSIRLSKTVLPT